MITQMYFISSDLHLEFYSDIEHISTKILEEIDVCVFDERVLFLCGDIGYPFTDNYSKFIEFCSHNFKSVLITTGNHEYYNIDDEGRSISDIDNKINEIVNSYDNVTFLNGSHCILEQFKIIVVGSTLWSAIVPSNTNYKGTSDFMYVVTDESNKTNSNMTLQEYHSLHEEHLEKLTDKIEEISKIREVDEYRDYDLIVMTHHLPSYLLIAPQYKGNRINQFFASDLDYLFEEFNKDSKTFIKYWFCGHTHTRMSCDINGTKIIVNPYGYPHELHDGESRNILHCI